jgi:hypothetical protein
MDEDTSFLTQVRARVGVRARVRVTKKDEKTNMDFYPYPCPYP